MPSAGTFNSTAIKALLVGRPGAGKTGSLISILLADPEARMFFLNFDRNNFGTIVGLAHSDPKTNTARDPAVVSRLLNHQIHFHHLEDRIQLVNGVPTVVGVPSAWTGAGKACNDWGEPLGAGGINNLGPKDWLVMDSISAMGDAALRYALHQMGRLNRRPEQSDWGTAINMLSSFLEMFNSPALPFNVLATTHVRFVGDQEAGTDEKGRAKELDMVPNALGQKLPQEIGRYFNNILEVRVVGEGPGSRRIIHTRSPGGLVLRSSNPGAVKPTYDVYDGMAQWLRDIRSVPAAAATGGTPPAPAQPPAAATTAPPQPGA